MCKVCSLCVKIKRIFVVFASLCIDNLCIGNSWKIKKLKSDCLWSEEIGHLGDELEGKLTLCSIYFHTVHIFHYAYTLNKSDK